MIYLMLTIIIFIELIVIVVLLRTNYVKIIRNELFKGMQNYQRKQKIDIANIELENISLIKETTELQEELASLYNECSKNLESQIKEIHKDP